MPSARLSKICRNLIKKCTPTSYRNLAEISCHVGHLDEACAALTKCVEEYDGRDVLADDILMLELLLYYKLGDTAHYEACRGEIWE